MSKASITSMMVLCAALAACADSATNGTPTAPGARRDVSEAPAGFAYTLDGPSDVGLSDDAMAQMAGAQMLGAQLAASPQAASGPRSTGHVGFPTGYLPPSFGLASEKYSYSALATDPAAPGAAKGQFEVSLTTVTGIEQRIQGDVVCINTFSGNTARVVGQITKIWRNDVRSPITTNTHAFWVVVDNGEGATSPPDQVSFVRFSNGTIAQNFCANGFLSFVFPNPEGNIQVQP